MEKGQEIEFGFGRLPLYQRLAEAFIFLPVKTGTKNGFAMMAMRVSIDRNARILFGMAWKNKQTVRDPGELAFKSYFDRTEAVS